MTDLRRLRYFLAVARERNFTRAAEQLHVAQPALSRQVSQLERELGVKLLRRTTHEVKLTDAGRFVLERGAALLSEADELWHETRAFGTGKRGRVRIAYGTSAGYETAPKLLASLAARLPEVTIATRVAPLAEIIAQLDEGDLDVAFARCPPARTGLEARVVRRERQGVLLRRDHALAEAATAAIADLAGETLLLHAREANPGHFDAVLALYADAGYEPALAQRALSLDLAQTPVAAGAAVAIVGESTLAGLPPDLAWVPLEPKATLDVALLAPARDRSPAVDRMLDLAQIIADELGWLDGDAAAR
jgi:DNA-binding transcriptional LysR family regulator